MTTTRSRRPTGHGAGASEPAATSPREFPPVRVVTGAAFELVAELAAFTSGPARGSLDSGKVWIREVRVAAGPELVRRVERFGLGVYAELATLALEAPEPRDVDDLLATIRSIGAGAFRRRLLGVDSAMTRSMVSDGAIERAIDGDAAARDEMRTVFGVDRGARLALDRVLETPPNDLHDELLGVVADWSEHVLPRFLPAALEAIARETATRETQLAGEVGGRSVVMAATRGVAYDPPAWIRSIVLAPTVAMRPFIVPMELGETALFLSSVADEAFEVDPTAPPRQLVKIAAALGDERRLRVLYVLRGGELTATEIAEQIGVDRTSLHHHLGILRSAGLLTIRDDGVAGWRYALREGGWSQVSSALDGYLRSPGD
jgi:DNA-binding transcriptional ArsR family regulator